MRMNSLKSLAMNCGPLSEMIRGRSPGNCSRGPLEDRLHLGFGHGLADLPVDDEPAVAVEDAAQEEECPADINMRDIDMPVLMRPQRLLEALALLGGLPASARELAGRLEHAVDAGRAHGHDIGVEHHVRQPPIAFQGITVVEVDDGGLLPILEPEVARDRGVVLVGCPQAPAPAAELAGGDAQPSHQQRGCKGNFSITPGKLAGQLVESGHADSPARHP